MGRLHSAGVAGSRATERRVDALQTNITTEKHCFTSSLDRSTQTAGRLETGNLERITKTCSAANKEEEFFAVCRHDVRKAATDGLKGRQIAAICSGTAVDGSIAHAHPCAAQAIQTDRARSSMTACTCMQPTASQDVESWQPLQEVPCLPPYGS
jgi:hypothetical protein